MTTLDLKRDPGNGFLIGPDECHYANVHQAMHYGLLHLCGCGAPEDAFNLCQKMLACFDRRASRRSGEWINAEKTLTELIYGDAATAAHVLAHLLTHLDLLEHGGSVGGSWLTTKGETVVDAGPMTEELMEQNWPETP